MGNAVIEPSSMDCETPTAASATGRRRFKAVVPIVSALVVIVIGVIAGMTPRKLQPGEIVSAPGRYRSPGGKYQIVIAAPSEGFKSITLARWEDDFWFWTTIPPGQQQLVDQERDWFHCFDEYDRLWSYTGPWDKGRGRTRQHPGGGFSSSVPSVTLNGWCYFQGRGPLRGSGDVVSCLLWEGIPETFFERIPNKDQPVWGHNPPIPSSAPEFTAGQDVAIRTAIADYERAAARVRR